MQVLGTNVLEVVHFSFTSLLSYLLVVSILHDTATKFEKRYRPRDGRKGCVKESDRHRR